MSKATVLQPGQGEQLNVVGERLRVLVDGKMTDGKYAVFENISEPGNGPPIHRHGRDDEFFYVVDGTVKFLIDGREFIVSAGGSALAPRGSLHTFVNAGTTPSRIIITCCPAGIEEAFREINELGKQGMENPETVTAVFKRIDLEILGPPLKQM